MKKQHNHHKATFSESAQVEATTENESLFSSVLIRPSAVTRTSDVEHPQQPLPSQL